MSLLMVPVGFEHGKYQFELAIVCKKCFSDIAWTGPVTLNFDDKTNPEPDLIGWKDGNPFIVVEVSLATIKADLGYKLKMYESNEIPYYVVYEVKADALHTFELENGTYMESPKFLDKLKAEFRKKD